MKKVMIIVFMFSLIAGFAANCRKQEEPSPVSEVKEEKSPVVEEKEEITYQEEEIKKPIEPTGNTYYVSPEGLDTNEGTRESPWSLRKANTSLQPGDMALIAGGTYDRPRNRNIKPANSGEQGKFIIYRAVKGEKPLLAGANDGVLLNHRSYICIDGIMVKDVRLFIEAEFSHHITINNCHFENASGGGKVLKFYSPGGYICVKNTYIKGGNGGDTLWVGLGEGHLIEGNTIVQAGHSCLTIMGIQRSVVRNNTLRNPDMKLMEVLALDAKYPKRFKDPDIDKVIGTVCKNVLIEHNTFDFTASYNKKGSEASAIQYCGYEVIVRRNIFQHTQLGIMMCRYPGEGGEAKWCYNNRIYNNVFFEVGKPDKDHFAGPALLFGFGDEEFSKGNIIANNIFSANKHYPCRKIKGLPETIQIIFYKTDPRHVEMFGNAFFGQAKGDMVIGNGVRGKPFTGYTLKDFEAAYSNYAYDNIEASPLFADASNGDFRLTNASYCIDAAQPLTRVKNAGKGTVIEVRDSLFFSDGYGLIPPDIIRVGKERVRALNVDYESNTITLDRSIQWEKDAPVNLDYKGNGPDIGAFEFGED